jgi:hypothetical protein
MTRVVAIIFALFVGLPVWADVQLFKTTDEDPELDKISIPITEKLTASPSREATFSYGFKMVLDDENYYIKPTTFMAKSKPDEICNPIEKSLTYRCKEGQPHVKGCHFLFFDARGKWIGIHTMKINEDIPHYCNAMPAMGVANRAKNELLVTMQYFLADGRGAKKVSELGFNWIRMTTLFRVKAINGKIEVEQDDSCLGNPNQIDTISKARKQLKRCASVRK